MGKPLFVPMGTFVINGNIDTKLVKKIVGVGTFKTSASGTLLLVGSDELTIDGINFECGGKNATAISTNGKRRLNFTNLRFKDFNNGIECSRVVDPYDQAYITNSVFAGCRIGIHVSQRSEYFNICDCMFNGNDTGIKIVGGNTSVQSCNITNNNIGIHVVNGENGGHGIIGNCQINHNKTNSIICESVTNGFTISGNNIWYGDLKN